MYVLQPTSFNHVISNNKVKESSKHLQIMDAKLEKLKLEILLTFKSSG
jgi:hypothetical protein